MFSYGEFKQEDQEKMLEQLNKKVEEVYRSCIGDNEANIRLVGLSIFCIPTLLLTWLRWKIEDDMMFTKLTVYMEWQFSGIWLSWGLMA